MAADPAEEVALWRYHLIAEALDRRLGSRERGLIVRRIADEEHVGPDGQPRPAERAPAGAEGPGGAAVRRVLGPRAHRSGVELPTHVGHGPGTPRLT